jgi:hypothetical protein
LFANYVAEIPTNGEVTKVQQFPMNKTERDTMQEILDKYIKIGILDALTSAWNASAFFVKSNTDLKILWRPRNGVWSKTTAI